MREAMNELNYASLEASKKLVENGIVLETDAVWGKLDTCDYGLFYSWQYANDDCIPAPCFTEVWRELPWVIDNYGLISMNKVDNITCCGYRKGMAIREPKFESENPTDALIDLLVWLSGEGNDQRR